MHKYNGRQFSPFEIILQPKNLLVRYEGIGPLKIPFVIGSSIGFEIGIQHNKMYPVDIKRIVGSIPFYSRIDNMLKKLSFRNTVRVMISEHMITGSLKSSKCSLLFFEIWNCALFIRCFILILEITEMNDESYLELVHFSHRFFHLH